MCLTMRSVEEKGVTFFVFTCGGISTCRCCSGVLTSRYVSPTRKSSLDAPRNCSLRTSRESPTMSANVPSERQCST